jgi:hypothetical protein
LGVDPAENIAKIAEEKGVPTLCDFFDIETANKIKDKFGTSKIVFARNVVPHVKDLHGVIGGLKTCLDDEGVLAIEAHYAKKIQEELHYDSIYHEHLCYFTLTSMENLLKLHDLHIFDVEGSPISGGSLVYYIKKGECEQSPLIKEIKDKESITGMNHLETWEKFAERTYKHKEKLLEIINKQPGKTVGYGASARSSTMLNFCGIDSSMIEVIADQNPLKHKKYTAGTHIPINSPEEVFKKNPDSVFILAWNFSDEIINILKQKYGFEGNCIVPLPEDPKIVKI